MKTKLILCGISVASLTACGGGGGGSSTLSAFLNPYSDEFNGPNLVGRATLYQRNFSVSEGGGLVTSFSIGGSSTGTLTAGTNNFGDPSSLEVSSGSVSILANESVGTLGGAQTIDGGVNAVIVNESTLGLAIISQLGSADYSSFGYWVSYSDLTRANASGAFFHSGYETPSSQLPTTGQAAYTGRSIGNYFAASEGYFVTESRMTLGADFAARSISVSSSQTTASSYGTGPSQDASSLNFTGAGAINSSSGTFSGVAQMSGITGSFDGRFYGPQGQELGGSFGFSNVAGRYIGAFGAAR